MTIIKEKNIKYTSLEERIIEAKKEFGQASDIAYEIYKSRENEPNENLLIINFYYSIYHLIKAISILDTGIDYNYDPELNKGLDTLFRYRDQYDYKDRFVIEEDYLEAEQLWLKIFPELEALVSNILNNA